MCVYGVLFFDVAHFRLLSNRMHVCIWFYAFQWPGIIHPSQGFPHSNLSFVVFNDYFNTLNGIHL